MGAFEPRELEDLKGLNHPPDDIAALKKCKPGSCDVKLGTKGLEAVSKIDWSAADAEKRAVAVFNQAIVDYVRAYQLGGTDAMGNVLDKKQEKSRAQEYRTLLTNSPYLVDYVKEFNDYLAAYPKGKLEGAEDVLYWAKDTFGLKPVVSGYHATLYESPRGVLISSKLLAARPLLQRQPRDHGRGAHARRQGPLPLEPVPDAARSAHGHAGRGAHGQGPGRGGDGGEGEPEDGPRRLAG